MSLNDFGPEAQPADTGNTDVEDLTAPLDPDDDVFRLLAAPGGDDDDAGR